MNYLNHAKHIRTNFPLQYWFMAARPKTLLAGLSPVIIGLALSYFEFDRLNWPIALLTILCALLMQIGSNLVNDYFDGTRGIDGPKRLGPKRVTANNLIPPENMRTAFLSVFLLAFIFGIILMDRGGLNIILIGLASLLTAYAYTAPPFNLSYFALGEILAFIFFGPIAVYGSYFLQNLEEGKLNSAATVAGFIPGAISAAILAINNLRDRESDMQGPKKTLTIIFGEKFGRTIILFLVFFPILITWIMPSMLSTQSSFLLLLTGIIPFLFWNTWKKVATGLVDQNLNFCLFKTSQYLFIFSILFSAAIISGR